MDKGRNITNADLDKALLAFGYVEEQRGSHSIYRHPQGKQAIVLPRVRRSDGAMPTHVKIVETAVNDDGVASVDDFRFFLVNGKLPSEVIQRGDKLIWTEPSSGVQIHVVAAAGEKDGMVIIKQKGTFSPCPVDQLRKVS